MTQLWLCTPKIGLFEMIPRPEMIPMRPSLDSTTYNYRSTESDMAYLSYRKALFACINNGWKWIRIDLNIVCTPSFIWIVTFPGQLLEIFMKKWLKEDCVVHRRSPPFQYLIRLKIKMTFC